MFAPRFARRPSNLGLSAQLGGQSGSGPLKPKNKRIMKTNNSIIKHSLSGGFCIALLCATIAITPFAAQARDGGGHGGGFGGRGGGFGGHGGGFGGRGGGFGGHEGGFGRRDSGFGWGDPGFGWSDPGFGWNDPGFFGWNDPSFGRRDGGFRLRDEGPRRRR
jgi:hypothetical protein